VTDRRAQLAAAEREIRAALAVVGVAAWGLGIEVDARLPAYVDASWRPHWRLDRGTHHPLTAIEARGWTALAAWIEGGVRPLEVLRSDRSVVYRVQLCGRVVSSTAAYFGPSLAHATASGHPVHLAIARSSWAAHADAGELALALAVLRRWVAPSRPWGLRDMIAEQLEQVGREATARAAGARWVPIVDPIPPGYLAAYGTASE